MHAWIDINASWDSEPIGRNYWPRCAWQLLLIGKWKSVGSFPFQLWLLLHKKGLPCFSVHDKQYIISCVCIYISCSKRLNSLHCSSPGSPGKMGRTWYLFSCAWHQTIPFCKLAEETTDTVWPMHNAMCKQAACKVPFVLRSVLLSLRLSVLPSSKCLARVKN